MAEEISRTTHGDAPLSAAKRPKTAAADAAFRAADSDELIGRTVTINCDRKQLYEFWRDFRNLPRFMDNIERVDAIDAERSHWVVSAPAGRTVEWDSIIVEDIPSETIAWRSADNASVRNSGRVEFRDASNGRGTQVSVTVTYDPPGGAIGKMVAKLFQREPKIQARRDLRRFKQLMEAGEVATAQLTRANRS